MHTQVAKDAAVQDEAVGEKWLRTLFWNGVQWNICSSPKSWLVGSVEAQSFEANQKKV